MDWKCSVGSVDGEIKGNVGLRMWRKRLREM